LFDSDWVKVERREIVAPFLPDLTKANCSSLFEMESQLFGDGGTDILDADQHLFSAIDYNTDMTKQVTYPWPNPN